MTLEKKIRRLASEAKQAARTLALASTDEKNGALLKMADALEARRDYLIRENKKDLKEAQAKNYPKALVDRLTLTDARIDNMIKCLQETAQLNDPVGEVLRTFERPNGLKIEKVRTPIGVIGIIYESRPNVTSDCIGLCLKSGNAVVLKGGKEAVYSNRAIFKVLKESLKETPLPREAIQLLESTDRKAVHVLLKQNDLVDLIVPRGGEGLIRFVSENSIIPVVKHYKGVCHVYVGEHADLNMAHRISLNAKLQRPGVCNAMETLLVHKDVAPRFLPVLINELQNAGVEIRGCPGTRRLVSKNVKRATSADWPQEYLDLILAVKVVDSLEAAIEHINTYGSGHSDTIVTDNKEEARKFLSSVDSACVYVNASTRFTDGYEFGFGAEIGISTDKLHARGPMALEELTTYKYLIYGTGQIRE